MPKSILRLQPCPLDLSWNDPAENLRRIEKAVRAGLPGGSVPEESLFLFPELTLTGFVTDSPPSFSVDDPPVRALGALAKKYGAALAAGFPEKNPDNPKRPYNTLALFGPDGTILGKYRKLHLFTFGIIPETEIFAAGDTGITIDYRGWKTGLTICFDLRFPALYSAYARAGADLILAPACWVGGEHKSYQFRTLGSAHAVLSQAFVASVNRSGRDPSYEYDGSRYVFSPFGEDLLAGSADGLALDPELLDACRKMKVRPSDLPEYPVNIDKTPEAFRGRFIHRIPLVRRGRETRFLFGGKEFRSENSLREFLLHAYGTEVLILDADSITMDVLEAELRNLLPSDMVSAFLEEVRNKGLNPSEERIVISKT